MALRNLKPSCKKKGKILQNITWSVALIPTYAVVEAPYFTSCIFFLYPSRFLANLCTIPAFLLSDINYHSIYHFSVCSYLLFYHFGSITTMCPNHRREFCLLFVQLIVLLNLILISTLLTLSISFSSANLFRAFISDYYILPLCL